MMKRRWFHPWRIFATSTVYATHQPIFSQTKFAHQRTHGCTQQEILPAGSVLQRGLVLYYGTDDNLRVLVGENRSVHFLQEVKNEVGQSVTESSFESTHYWIEKICSILALVEHSPLGLVSIRFPAILLKSFGQFLGSTIQNYIYNPFPGPYLAVARAVFSERPVVQPLRLMSTQLT